MVDMSKIQEMKSMMQSIIGMMDEMMSSESMPNDNTSDNMPLQNRMSGMKSKKEMSM